MIRDRVDSDGTSVRSEVLVCCEKIRSHGDSFERYLRTTSTAQRFTYAFAFHKVLKTDGPPGDKATFEFLQKTLRMLEGLPQLNDVERERVRYFTTLIGSLEPEQCFARHAGRFAA